VVPLPKLIHYWRMSNLFDSVGNSTLFNGITFQNGASKFKGADLAKGYGCSFTFDRFCNPNQAIYFNSSYLQGI